MIKINRISFSFLTCFYLSGFTTTLNAQVFTHKAKVDAVTQKGFYRIPLNTALSGKAQGRWQDLRLFDAQGNEVPYVLKKEEPYQVDQHYVVLNILKTELGPDKQILYIENPNKRRLNTLLLDIQNAETDRSVRISGSSDMKTWFGISDSMDFVLWGMSNETTQRKAIEFPNSNYPFLKIEIDRKNKEPLNITQVGYSTDARHDPKYTRINGLQYTTKQSGSKTQLELTFTDPHTIDQLQFFITEPAYYQRHLTLKPLTQNRQVYSIKHRYAEYDQSNFAFELSSASHGVLATEGYLGYMHHQKLLIEIENNNDQPLRIDSIGAFQLSSHIIAELKPGNPYFIYVGDSNLDAPLYDLRYFESKIPEQLPTAQVGPMQPKQQKLQGEYSGDRDRYMVWSGMGILAVFLIFITRNLMKKMA